MRCGILIALVFSATLCTGCKSSVVWPQKANSTSESFDPFLQPADSADSEQVEALNDETNDTVLVDGDVNHMPDEPTDTAQVEQAETQDVEVFPVGVVSSQTVESAAAEAAKTSLQQERQEVEAEIASTMLLLAEQSQQQGLNSDESDTPEVNDGKGETTEPKPEAEPVAQQEQTADDAETPEAIEARRAIQQAFVELEGELANPESRIGSSDLPAGESPDPSNTDLEEASEESSADAATETEPQGVSE